MILAGEPVEWLKRTAAAGRPIAAICHGPIPLAAAGLVSGRRMTGTGPCKDHITIMGGSYDRTAAAVVDGTIITGRVPSDVPEFLDAMTYALLREPA